YRPPEHPPQPGQPQVVIMPGPVGQRNPWLNSGLPQQQLPQPPTDFYKTQPDRRFKVVGEDEHWLDAEPY
ncbi:MAG: hypothetical protein U9R25_10545, partial [Chloroflexota bacterium]|nr:hypothetical protein [Chloroflexota bacterium]